MQHVFCSSTYQICRVLKGDSGTVFTPRETKIDNLAIVINHKAFYDFLNFQSGLKVVKKGHFLSFYVALDI